MKKLRDNVCVRRFISLILVVIAIVFILSVFNTGYPIPYFTRSITDQPVLSGAEKNNLEMRLREQLLRDSSIAHMLSDTIIAVLRKHGEYIQFSMAPNEGGGGIYAIAKMTTNDSFEVIWQGQDTPPCTTMEIYSIPNDIAPYCVRENIEQRGTLMQKIFSKVR